MSRRPFVRKVSTTRWWLQRPHYIRYMLREISALFIGGYAFAVIFGWVQLSRGEAAFDRYIAVIHGAGAQLLAWIALLFALGHTASWFQVTPKAMPLTFSGTRVPGVFIIAAHWLGFTLLSFALWEFVR